MAVIRLTAKQGKFSIQFFEAEKFKSKFTKPKKTRLFLTSPKNLELGFLTT